MRRSQAADLLRTGNRIGPARARGLQETDPGRVPWRLRTHSLSPRPERTRALRPENWLIAQGRQLA